jgi:hypothetical protein
MSKWLRKDKLAFGLRMLIAVIIVLVFILVTVFAVSFSSFISVSMNMSCPEIFELENFYLLTLAPIVLIIFSLIPGALVLMNFQTKWWKVSAALYVLILVLLYGIWFIIIKTSCG